MEEAGTRGWFELLVWALLFFLSCSGEFCIRAGKLEASSAAGSEEQEEMLGAGQSLAFLLWQWMFDDRAEQGLGARVGSREFLGQVVGL